MRSFRIRKPRRFTTTTSNDAQRKILARPTSVLRNLYSACAALGLGLAAKYMPSALWSTRRLFAVPIIILGLATVAGLITGSDTAAAQPPSQSEEYIDLAVFVEMPATIATNEYFNVTVANIGNRTAYDVVVNLEFLIFGSPVVDGRTGKPGLPIGTFTVDGVDRKKGVWKIEELPANRRYIASFRRSTHQFGVDGFSATASTVEDSETASRMENNTAIVYVQRLSSRVSIAGTSFAVDVSVNDRKPAIDGTGTAQFKVTASKGTRSLAGIVVNVAVTPGLTPGTPTFDPSDGGLTYDSTTGVFNIGNKPSIGAETYTMTLPVTVANGAVLENQCLTARITAIPAAVPGLSRDDPFDNQEKLCLGAFPVSSHDTGKFRPWAVYPCVGTTADPCDANDDVKVFGVDLSSIPVRILENETALIHVNDVPGRVFDANDGSVNSGTTVSWQTGTAEDSDFTGTRKGVYIEFNASLEFRPTLDDWEKVITTYSATDADGNDPPGDIVIRSSRSGTVYDDMTSSKSYQSDAYTYTLTNPMAAALVEFVEFSALGTYKVTFEAEVFHASRDADSDGEFDSFTATNDTIFHVGPIAELGGSGCRCQSLCRT